MDEDLDLRPAEPDDFRHFVQRAFARQHDAGEALLAQFAHALDAVRRQLRRGVQRERREVAAHEPRHAEVLHDEGVGAELLERVERVEQRPALALVHERVDRDVDAAGARQRAREREQGAEAVRLEVLGLGAGGERGQAKIHRVRAAAEGGDRGVEGAGRCKQFGKGHVAQGYGFRPPRSSAQGRRIGRKRMSSESPFSGSDSYRNRRQRTDVLR